MVSPNQQDQDKQKVLVCLLVWKPSIRQGISIHWGYSLVQDKANTTSLNKVNFTITVEQHTSTVKQ